MAAPIKRVIKDYKTLGQEHIDLINEHFPNGFENEHLISFTTPKGQFIKALEIKTEDTIYLFKIDKNMQVDDEENQENEGMAMGEFENYKGGDSDDAEDDADEDSDDADDAGDDGGEDDNDDNDD
jgi:DNA-directed RNA polymerase subunit delta